MTRAPRSGSRSRCFLRGEQHRRVWELLGIEPVPLDFEPGDFYPDALRRGPGDHLQRPPEGVLSIRGLDELTAALEAFEAA